jgi:hypothetical protein
MSRPNDNRPDDNREELFTLLDAYCHPDGARSLSDEQSRRLAEILRGSSRARRDYLEYMDLHAALQWEVGSRAEIADFVRHSREKLQAESAPPPPKSAVLGFLNRLSHAGGETPSANALTWFVMAIVSSGIAMTIFLCILLTLHRGASVPGDRQNVAGGNGQANSGGEASHPSPAGRETAGTGNDRPLAHPSTFSLQPSSTPGTVARLIHAADCRWAIGSHSPHLGDDLEPGRKLVLLSGLADIMFQSGVRALLQGPATLEIGSRRSTLLARGKLTVCVLDPDAHGFQVLTPGMRYTDLGTEFGVWVAKDGRQEMVVFRGRVQAEKVDEMRDGANSLGHWGMRDKGSGTKDEGPQSPSKLAPSLTPGPSSSPIIVSANEAIRIASPSKPIERQSPGKLAAIEKRFFRAVPASDPFSIFSTGAGLDYGAADPHWSITSISTNPGFKPQQAIVAEPLQIYPRGNRNQAQWIARTKALTDEAAGCRWTFCTHFDLSGFEPSTAKIEGQISADDYVAEIRLNGKPLPVPPGAREPWLYQWRLALKIEEGFVSGDNTLEIVIENGPATGGLNTVAMCLDWKGTARRVISTDDRD